MPLGYSTYYTEDKTSYKNENKRTKWDLIQKRNKIKFVVDNRMHASTGC